MNQGRHRRTSSARRLIYSTHQLESSTEWMIKVSAVQFLGWSLHIGDWQLLNFGGWLHSFSEEGNMMKGVADYL